MKILHLNYLPSAIVLKDKKIKDLAEAARRSHQDLEFVILNGSVNKTESNLKYIKIEFPDNKWLRVLAQKLLRYHYISKYVDFSKYERIILRYPLAFGLGLTKFYHNNGDKLYTEHHTNEGAEIRKIGSVRLIGKILAWYENYKKGQILGSCRGIIGVTDEIREHESSFSPDRPSHTMSNGINVQAMKISKQRTRNDNSINIIFIAARFAPWHGLDYAINGLRDYTGDTAITLHIVGNITKLSNLTELKNAPDHVNLELHDELHGELLDQLFDRMDLGISSLGIHRVGLHEASVLKTREYLSRSIPFVYGYKDSDLTGEEPFAHQVDMRSKQALDFDEIVRFDRAMKSEPDLKHRMRTEALEKIDWRSKLDKLVEFIEKN